LQYLYSITLKLSYENYTTMLLLEEKDENSHLCYFDSSNILACKYRRDNNQLAIIFKGGTQYVYEGVVPYIFQRFKVAKSQGKEFNSLIRNQYDYFKAAGGLDLTEVYKTIEELKKNQNT
jgi:hypothetical protein